MHRWIARIVLWGVSAFFFLLPFGKYIFEHLAAHYGWWDHPAESASSFITVLQAFGKPRGSARRYVCSLAT